ncbi:N-acyl-aromatic-L-amino acid amidohydrolase [Acrasis kona]|uniref:N-acyl-aromatic-L-amino acid amidohydrolase n=1 Tax=Acrasis kona TaxID=1008807 RepID=A0AAW2Z9F6_9EUKA
MIQTNKVHEGDRVPTINVEKEESVLQYSIAHCSSEDHEHPSNNLLTLKGVTKVSGGWATARLCKYPQILILKLPPNVLLDEISKSEFLINVHKQPTFIETEASFDGKVFYRTGQITSKSLGESEMIWSIDTGRDMWNNTLRLRSKNQVTHIKYTFDRNLPSTELNVYNQIQVLGLSVHTKKRRDDLSHMQVDKKYELPNAQDVDEQDFIDAENISVQKKNHAAQVQFDLLQSKLMISDQVAEKIKLVLHKKLIVIHVDENYEEAAQIDLIYKQLLSYAEQLLIYEQDINIAVKKEDFSYAAALKKEHERTKVLFESYYNEKWMNMPNIPIANKKLIDPHTGELNFMQKKLLQRINEAEIHFDEDDYFEGKMYREDRYEFNFGSDFLDLYQSNIAADKARVMKTFLDECENIIQHQEFRNEKEDEISHEEGYLMALRKEEVLEDSVRIAASLFEYGNDSLRDVAEGIKHFTTFMEQFSTIFEPSELRNKCSFIVSSITDIEVKSKQLEDLFLSSIGRLTRNKRLGPQFVLDGLMKGRLGNKPINHLELRASLQFMNGKFFKNSTAYCDSKQVTSHIGQVACLAINSDDLIFKKIGIQLCIDMYEQGGRKQLESVWAKLEGDGKKDVLDAIELYDQELYNHYIE